MKLEDFIRQNRAAFDDKEPSEKAWKNIAASTAFSASKNLWNSVVLWRAAAIVFMVVSAYLLISKNISIPSTNDKLALKEFKDVEAFYIQQISEKVELIDELQKSVEVEDFTHDFQQLEAMYMVLKEEMKSHPSKKVKDALVLNLLVRINLLNQQLHQLDEIEQTDRENKSANI